MTPVTPAQSGVVAPPGQPGVNVYSTLTPRQPGSTVTQPTSTLPGQPANPYQQLGPGYAIDNVIWYPSVTGATFFDDNVFASNRNRQGDWAGVVRPELAWRSNNWANMEAVGSYFVEKRWYDKFNSEDQLNGGAAVGATIRPGENTQVVTRMQYLHAHEDRGTSDSINATFNKPLQYNQLEAAFAINQRYDRFWTSVGGAAAFVHFDNGTLAGTVIPQDYRNGAISSIPIRVGYVVAPLTSVFIEGAANHRNFRIDSFDSTGYRLVGGALFEPGPGSRIRGEIFGGYMNQDYNGIGFKTVSTFTYGSSLAFLVRPDLTAVLEGRRDAREASLSAGQFAGTPGDGVSVIESVVSGRMDWSITPNLVVGAGVAYLQDEYLTANRTDEAWSPLASLKYFVNQRLTVGFDYRYLTFDSSGLGVAGYYKNVYLFSANLKL